MKQAKKVQRSAPISHVDELKRLRDENGLKDAEIARLKLRQAAVETEMEKMKLTLAVLTYLLYLLYGYKRTCLWLQKYKY